MPGLLRAGARPAGLPVPSPSPYRLSDDDVALLDEIHRANCLFIWEQAGANTGPGSRALKCAYVDGIADTDAKKGPPLSLRVPRSTPSLYDCLRVFDRSLPSGAERTNLGY